MAGGGVTNHLGNVLPHGGLSGVIIWGRSLGADGSNTTKLKGVQVGFLWKETGKKTQRLEGNSWRKVAAERMLQAEGTKPLKKYIDKRQSTVAAWLSLRPIFEVFIK